MKTDLDAILRENDLDGMLVVGSGMHNPAMVYLTGIAHLTGADLIWKTGEGGTLFHGPMERDEAARSGLRLRSYSLYPLGELLKESEGDMTRAMALRYEKMFKECDLTQGRVVILGAGTGNPYFTTDTAAALRAMEIDAELLIKATKVDGVYAEDPMVNPQARRFDYLTYIDALNMRIGVIDSTAITLCMDNHLPIVVLDLWQPEALLKAVLGEPTGTIISH